MTENVIERILRTHQIKSITQRKNGMICIRFKRPKQRRINRYQQRPKPHDYSKAQTKLSFDAKFTSEVKA